MTRLAFARAKHQALRARLLAEDPDLDEQTLADTLEGLTDLNEIIAAILRAALGDEALAEGLRTRVSEMQGRLERLTERASKRRQIAREVMIEAEIKKIVAPDLTVSLRLGSPGLTIVDEVAIPAAYWEPRAPRLNRQALLSDLKQGRSVTGALLSNPEPLISIRTK
jgi:hypothetical protein